MHSNEKWPLMFEMGLGRVNTPPGKSAVAAKFGGLSRAIAATSGLMPTMFITRVRF